MSRNEVGTLKHAWLQAFLIEGTVSEKREQWRAFKERICGKQIDDSTMLRSQYDLLKAALPIHQEHPS